MAEYRPAADPFNGPVRLVVDRTPEQRDYDRTDWPSSSSFRPSHLQQLGKRMLDSLQVERIESVESTPEPESTQEQ